MDYCNVEDLAHHASISKMAYTEKPQPHPITIALLSLQAGARCGVSMDGWCTPAHRF